MNVERDQIRSAMWMQAGAASIANLVSVVALQFLREFLLSKSAANTFDAVVFSNRAYFLLVNAFPFPLSIGLIMLYYGPVARALFQKDVHWTPLSLRKVLNAPIFVSALAMAGWVWGWAATQLILLHSGRSLPGLVLDNLILVSVLATITFVVSYYLLESINRRYVMRSVDGLDPFLIPGVHTISLRARLFVFFLATGVVPTVIFLRILQVQGADLPVASMAGWLGPALLLVGTGLTFFQSYSIRDPLRGMRDIAIRVRDGDFETRVPIESTDEIGFLAASINEMSRGLAERERLRATFDRAVDKSVREHLMSSDSPGELREVTLLFADIAGFTTLSETLRPDEVVSLLNRLFEKIADAIAREGGVINKFIGDAVFAVFGAPQAHTEHERAAISAALGIRQALLDINRELTGEGRREVRMRMGVHTGRVLAGLVGARSRLEYTLIGDPVNTAARLESACKKVGTDLLVSEETIRRANWTGAMEFVGSLKLRGKQSLVRAWRIPSAT